MYLSRAEQVSLHCKLKTRNVVCYFTVDVYLRIQMKCNAVAVVTRGLRYVRCKIKMVHFNEKRAVTSWMQTSDTDFIHTGIQAFLPWKNTRLNVNCVLL